MKKVFFLMSASALTLLQSLMPISVVFTIKTGFFKANITLHRKPSNCDLALFLYRFFTFSYVVKTVVINSKLNASPG